ncbi:probable LRR receptor-like serine/threonine-protein kinase At2g16250 isoform X2 [Impatiens glandulifera]|uniref:probable LRR receptor-like serine/threonine-protein kinase At2g16250 isoform X2 n=1 Tax=Impatiens glandulifera TaxID=253017 RepID=UPI001FB0DFE0|nr:probable LRR receptor-like serine/threonine-protein kinase At2g16250 isoform X2 [Impatiens glandulifera]
MVNRVFTILACIILFLLFDDTLEQTLPSERAALKQLRSSLALRRKEWPIKSDPCSSWTGIQCQNGHVVEINISGFKRTRVGGRNPQFAVDSLANLTILSSFNASNFNLPGPIPDWFGLRLSSLKLLDLRSCSVTNSIPSSLGALNNLTILVLSNNSVTGTIPSSLGQLSSLSFLDLSQNSLTGSIPSSFSSLLNLTFLDISSNFLSGIIPPFIGSLSKMKSLSLSNNSLSSPIPSQLGNLTNLVHLDLSFNSLSGTFHAELWSRMPELVLLDVSNNMLTGTLSNLTLNSSSTALLNLSSNMFYGSLTTVLKSFILTDLSSNYFQGIAPNDALRNETLDRNCLGGLSNQRTAADCSSFYSDKEIPFDNFGLPNATGPPINKKNRHRSLIILAVVLGGVGIIAIFAVLTLLIILCSRKKEQSDNQREINIQNGPSTATSPGFTLNFLNLGEGFTYEKIIRATDNFSDGNLIKKGHSGDLFRGLLENGTFVVIKRVDLSYESELDFFSKVSHTRFVPLLGYCLEKENEKFLIYKHMPNGDLTSSFYRKKKPEDDSLQSLDWITRIKVAIGAAEALSYLHHECSPPMVHRGSDKSSSGSSTWTFANDVYCFGKVLLELITGKIELDGSKDESAIKEWLEASLPCISIYEKELITNIVDPSLIIDEDLLEEVWSMAIVAKSCLNPRPSRRPLMRYVVKALENPLKVIRIENTSSGKLRTISSTGSWNTAFLGSWRHSSSSDAGKEGIMGRSISRGGGQNAAAAIDRPLSMRPLSRENLPEANIC